MKKCYIRVKITTGVFNTRSCVDTIITVNLDAASGLMYNTEQEAEEVMKLLLNLLEPKK